LVFLTISIILVGDSFLRIGTQDTEALYDQRKKLCEFLAVQYSTLAQKGETETIRASMLALVNRNPDVISTAIRTADGQLVATAGDHLRYWKKPVGDRSTLTYAQVPVFDGNARWGSVEVSFASSDSWNVKQILANPLVELILMISGGGFVVYFLFMKKTLRHLDPSAVVPQRVKTTLDTLAEGVFIVDGNGRIVLANEAFSRKIGRDPPDLVGCKASDFDWRYPKLNEAVREFPWIVTLKTHEVLTGFPLALVDSSGKSQTFKVNCSPILDGDSTPRGVMVTFDDVTILEQVNDQLRKVMTELEASRDQISHQNKELKRLATVDPLTGCLNRRAFFELLEPVFKDALANNRELCCIMTDIDHFKSFNDRFGHAVGDQVIQAVVNSLNGALRNSDLLCRYGGEEFCLMLPGLDVGRAAKVAERVRSVIETEGGAGVRTDMAVRVTSSFGVSSIGFGANTPAELIDQADLALYAAKEAGRNRVTFWDEMQTQQATANCQVS
jgi:diguanylate cyclase (GGDEF)-like protein/PAS domain S-box-containing protein